METKTKEVCDVCLGKMVVGQGKALFTAECSHIFHFSCIASRVKHGCYFCPTCRATWTHLFIQSISTRSSFTDDKPLPATTPEAPNTNTNSSPTPPHPHSANMIVTGLPQYPALISNFVEQSSSSAVLNGIQAPCSSLEVSARQIVHAPPDFIAVLDEIQIKADEIMETCRRNRENARS